MKPHYILLGMLALLVAAACSHQLQEEKSAYAPTAEESAWIQKRLLTIKHEKSQYSTAMDDLRWKLALCTAVIPDPYPIQQADTAFNRDSLRSFQEELRQSQSEDMETHGKALYRLFVKSKGDYAKAPKHLQPENQVIVKATYEPIWLDTAAPHSDKKAALGADGKWYREGAPDDLYIMFRTDRKGIQTDAGWVYGIVSMNEDKVIAQGLLQNCMGCHRRNDPGRLFGVGE